MPAPLRTAGLAALWHPELLLAAVCLAVAYLQITGPLRDRFAEAAPVDRRRRLAFVGGLAILYVAEGSPLAILSNRFLLSAHMFQTVLLLLWAPPLLLFGTPEWLLRPVVRVPAVRAAVGFLTRPVRALVLFVCVFSLYLFPGLTDGALHDPWLYFVEHAVSLLAAGFMWWPLLSPLPELPALSEPLQLLYTFIVEVLMTVAFGIITFANHPIYPTFARAAPLVGVSALADQQLAGIVMRLGSLASYGVSFGVALRHWMRREEAAFPHNPLLSGPAPGGAGGGGVSEVDGA